MAFYHRWYLPSHAILVVAGHVAPDHLQALAEKHYGVLPSGPPGVRTRALEPEHTAPRHVTMQDPRIKHSLWMRLYLTPAYGTLERHRMPAAEVFAALLG